jgi:hypothetical protein
MYVQMGKLYPTTVGLYCINYDRSWCTAADDLDMTYRLSTNDLYRSVHQLSNLAEPI